LGIGITSQISSPTLYLIAVRQVFLGSDRQKLTPGAEEAPGSIL